MYGTSEQEGSTGLPAQIMTYKFSSKIEDAEDRPNEFLELVGRYDEVISNTPEPLNTDVKLNVGKLGNFNALRVATEII